MIVNAARAGRWFQVLSLGSLLSIAAGCHTRPPPGSAGTGGAAQTVSAADAGAAGLGWSGRAIYFDSHCGGARLTDEQMARLRRPARDMAFLVLAGTRNTSAEPAATIRTDAEGAFRVQPLPPGSYCIVDASRRLAQEQEERLLALPPPTPWHARAHADDGGLVQVDPECLARLPLECDFRWELTAENQARFAPDLVLQGSRCPWNRPCSTYRGPAPP